MKPELTAVSYLRVSTKEQADKAGEDEGYSIPAQREANRRKADSLGATIIAEFTDRGESARSADRPQLKALLSFIAGQSVDFVLVHKVDRLARNRLDDAEINLAITTSGARLISATENIDETPSGMLLHGIMSSIAEFYSRNLATEVTKGMVQKAKSGGTPTMAPIGYLNVGVKSSEGREVRTVTVDPERAPHIQWAFATYANGDWTLGALTTELEDRGLRSRATPKRPSKPLSVSQVHRFLRSPYYRGVIVWNGVEHAGSHEPIISPEVWDRVQAMLDAHRVGEKTVTHPHYLKSTVFCGRCKSRLMVSYAKNRHGRVYPYFLCTGRHTKRTDCTQKAVLIPTVEDRIVELYEFIAIPDALRDDIESTLRVEFETLAASRQDEADALNRRRQAIKRQQAQLLQAHYAGAVPLDLLKDEQDRLGRDLRTVESRLAALQGDLDQVQANLKIALDLARDCASAYRDAPDPIRRLFNQAFFTRIEIDDEDIITATLAEPFETLSGRLVEVGGAGNSPVRRGSEGSSNCRLSDHVDAVLASRQGSRTGKPAQHLCRTGLRESQLVPPTGFEPVLPP